MITTNTDNIIEVMPLPIQPGQTAIITAEVLCLHSNYYYRAKKTGIYKNEDGVLTNTYITTDIYNTFPAGISFNLEPNAAANAICCILYPNTDELNWKVTYQIEII